MTKKKPARRAPTYPGVFAYETAAGTRYRYSFDAPPRPDGTRDPRTKRGFLTELDAWEAMQERKRALRLSGYVEPSEETLDEYFARWMRDTQHGRRVQTNQNYTLSWRRLPAPFRELTLRAVTPSHIRTLYAALVHEYAASTCRSTRTLLRMVLTAAQRDRLIPESPATGIPLPVNRDDETAAQLDPEHVWSVEESNRFLAATADHRDHVLWRFLLDSGLRIGEALALTWDDLNLTARTVSVRRTLTTDASGQTVVGTQPKTRSSRRVVTLYPDTVTALQRHQTAQKVQRMRLGVLWREHNLVFPDEDGGLVMRAAASLRLTRTAQALGFRPMSPHGLRHTMAVTWLRAGKSPKVVSERLGHASVAFTLDVYTKVSLDWQQSDAEDVEAFIKRGGKPLPPPEPEGMLVQFPEQG